MVDNLGRPVLFGREMEEKWVRVRGEWLGGEEKRGNCGQGTLYEKNGTLYGYYHNNCNHNKTFRDVLT